MNNRIIIFFLWILGTFAIILFLYHRILSAYLVADEYAHWKTVRNLDFINSFRLFLPSEFGGVGEDVYYRPVGQWWPAWFNTVVLPMKPFFFHLTTLIIHWLNTLFVGLLALQFFKNKKSVFLASLLFAVFPFHSEAVIYSVGGRENVIATFFYMLSLLQVMFFAKTNNKYWYLGICATYMLALMSTESAATLPLAVFLFFYVYQKLSIKTIINHHWYLFLSLIGVFILYFIIRSMVLHSINPYELTGYMNASFTVNNVFRLYIGMLLGCISVRLVTGNRIRFLSRRENIFWFYVLLIGILFLPTFYIPTQERHLYLPSFAFVLAEVSVFLMIKDQVANSINLKRFLFLAIVFVLLGSGIFLMIKNERYRRASDVAERISKEVAQTMNNNIYEKKFYFLNFPDSIDGAYVYRVQVKDAIEFSLGRDITQELIFTPLILGEESKVSVIDKNSIDLKSEGGFILFLPRRDREGKQIISSKEFIATKLDEKTLHVDFLEEDFDIRKSNIFVFQDGSTKHKPF